MINPRLSLLLTLFFITTTPSFASEGWNPFTSPNIELPNSEDVIFQAEDAPLASSSCIFFPIKWGEVSKKPPVMRSKHKSDIFIGRLPFGFTIENFQMVFQHLFPNLAFSNLRKGAIPNCAYIEVDSPDTLPLLRAYNERVLCTRNGMLVAPLGNEKALAELTAAVELRSAMQKSGGWDKRFPHQAMTFEDSELEKTRRAQQDKQEEGKARKFRKRERDTESSDER